VAKVIRVPIELELFDVKTRESRRVEIEIWVNPENVTEIAPDPNPDRDLRSHILYSNGKARIACLSAEDLVKLLFPYGRPGEKPQARFTTLKEAIT